MLKDKIKQFLQQQYKNPLTQKSAEIALKRISHLEKIDIDEINKIYCSIPAKLLSNSSKNTELAYIKKFINVISGVDQIYYDVHRLVKFENDSKPKETFNESEINIIRQELKIFGNKQFELIFELLLYNGCRLGEFCKVKWESMVNNDYQYQIKSSKHGNYRIIVVPEHLRDTFNEVGITYSYNTIQNYFYTLQKQIKTKYPNWHKKVHAHILRAQLITNMHMRGLSVDEIQVATAHVQQSTITNFYIKTSSTYQARILKLANMDVIDSIDYTNAREIIMKQNNEIILLQDEVLSLKEYINELHKKFDIDNAKPIKLLEKVTVNDKTENANVERSEIKYKTAFN